jgi:hypothetical protein
MKRQVYFENGIDFLKFLHRRDKMRIDLAVLIEAFNQNEEFKLGILKKMADENESRRKNRSECSAKARNTDKWKESNKRTASAKGKLNKGVKKKSNEKYIEVALSRPVEHYQKVSAALTGIPLTEDRRNNISDSCKKRKVCPYCNSFESNVANTNRHMNNYCKNRPGL